MSVLLRSVQILSQPLAAPPHPPGGKEDGNHFQSSRCATRLQSGGLIWLRIMTSKGWSNLDSSSSKFYITARFSVLDCPLVEGSLILCQVMSFVKKNNSLNLPLLQDSRTLKEGKTEAHHIWVYVHEFTPRDADSSFAHVTRWEVRVHSMTAVHLETDAFLQSKRRTRGGG